MTNDEIVEILVARHFKKLESRLLELNLPSLVYITISKEFRWLESDLKKGLSFQGDDLKYFLTGEK
jgi:hypothetical protein